jgi:hypothetical protein
VRWRFWAESGLAALAAILLVVTLISREWIEEVFRVDPDGGSGAAEWLAVGALLVLALGFGALARLEWRRGRRAATARAGGDGAGG